MLLTLGSLGSCLVEDQRLVRAMLHEPVDAIDTTGAGDCFTAAFASYVAAGLTLEEAMKLAGRVASLSVLSKGCQSSYRKLGELPKDLQAPLVSMIRGRSAP